MKVLRDLNQSGQREVPADAPMLFRSKQWKELVLEDGKPDRRLYETAVLATLRDRLRSGDVWIERTRNYQLPLHHANTFERPGSQSATPRSYAALVARGTPGTPSEHSRAARSQCARLAAAS